VDPRVTLGGGLKILPVLMVMLLQGLPCVPGESSLVCHCKAGDVGPCLALVSQDAEQAKDLLEKVLKALDALEAAAEMGAGTRQGEKDREALEATAKALESEQASAEPPDCKGQEHHVISRRIARALERHATLKGLYKARDPRFVARAKDESSHCGYQDWHRKVDKEIEEWLEAEGHATPSEFLEKLREIYSRADMQVRFPNGF